ncbi:MAG TPA: 50S ribosomal protein L30e [Candidatus Bathyarchaeia archaeon]|nr:50S ribosomal protein L30e [Candidatus Bathyarchaeia archaeon]
MIDVDKAIGTAVKTGKVVLGANEAVKNAQSGKAKLIVVAANCPINARGDIEYYGRLSGVNIVVYKGTSIDLGMACGKPFMVSALSVKEPGDSDILKLGEQPSLEEEEIEEAPFEPLRTGQEVGYEGAEEEEERETEEQFEETGEAEEGSGEYAEEDNEDA